MSRPLFLSTLALALGIVGADALFYRASAAVPSWLGIGLWGFCLLVWVGAVLVYRRVQSPRWQRRLFVLPVLLFFAVVGFARYGAEADAIRHEWQSMEQPPANRGNPDEFDYRRWRWVQDAEADSTSFLGRCRQGALRVRAYLIQRYAREGLDGDTLALVAAVTLGDRSHLSRSMRNLYADAGASHLLALSGLHLSIIVGFALVWLEGRWVRRRRRWLLALLLLAFVWSYALVAALPTSLVRASLMMTVYLVASLLRRHGHPLQPLLLTAWLMLLLRPFYLFDVGAQLSFAAVAGIVVLHGKWWRWAFLRWRFGLYSLSRWHLLPVVQLFSVSLAAQVATLPLVLFYFHRFPLYGPVFNLLFVPLTTLLIYGALLLLALSFFPALAGFSLSALLARVLTWLVALQLTLMRTAVDLPGAVVHDFWSRPAAPQVVVYHARRCPALHVIVSPEQSWLLMPQPDSLGIGLHSIAATFWERRLAEPPAVLRGRTSIALRGYALAGAQGNAHLEGNVNFTAVMVGEEFVGTEVPVGSGATEVSLLWITRGFRGGSLNVLAGLYRPRLLVLDASLPRWQREALSAEARRLHWPAYDVAVQGALRLPLYSGV